MKASIIGRQSGPLEITIGSDLTVGAGWNLLAIHEFGADVHATSAPWLTFSYPLGAFTPDSPSATASNRPTSDPGWARKKQVRIPRRPTAPFDWDSGELIPAADALVQSRISDYLTEISR
jgi:hypothetical protein